MRHCSLQRAGGVWPMVMVDGTDQSGNRHEPVMCSDSVLSAISYQRLSSMNHTEETIARKILPEQGRNSLVGACMPRIVCTGHWKHPRWLRAEVTAVRPVTWHEGCEGTVSEV